MLDGQYNIPLDYGQTDLYNTNFSPSTVHTSNTGLQRYFRKYLLQKAISVFKWSLPEEWDPDYFKYTLYGLGYIAVLNTRTFGVICQGGALGGYNLYYRPKYIMISNPLLKGTITADIDKDCALIKLQPDYSSIMDIVTYYADEMALAAEAMAINLNNTKTSTIFGAETQAQAAAYKKMFDEVNKGNPAVVVGKKLLDDSGNPTWFPFVQNLKEQYLVSDILADMRKIEAMFDTDIGIPNANTDKKERLITDEVNANNVETATKCEQWLESIQRGVERANSFYGLNISVDWRVKPEAAVSEDKTEGVE